MFIILICIHLWLSGYYSIGDKTSVSFGSNRGFKSCLAKKKQTTSKDKLETK